MPDRVATLSQVFEAQAQKHGARVFLKDKPGKVWTDHSWTEISDAAGKLRAGLPSLGVRPGDRVAILSENCPEWIVVDQAVLGLGAIVVPLYTTSGLEETAHVINDSGAKIIAANGPEMIQKILGLGSSIPGLTAIIAMHRGAESAPAANGTPAIVTLASVSGDAPAAIVEGSQRRPRDDHLYVGHHRHAERRDALARQHHLPTARTRSPHLRSTTPT